MKIKQPLLSVLDDIKLRLPPILAEKGARQFEGYSIGFPADPEKLLLCVRFAAMDASAEDTLEFDVHAQFPGTLEIDVYGYIDAVNDYLEGLDPQIAGFADMSYSGIAHDNPRTAAIEIFWSVKLTRPKDDCDL